ncbi:MAG: tRNA nucleotidyltransferase [Clostridia bacterium]|nr:tRNA nucleotidyltransferase [Clostridia bacterium]
MTGIEVARAVAEEAAKIGGRAYYVGGCVRDFLRGVDAPDLDVEVYGVAPETLAEILAPFGALKTEGQKFGVYSLEKPTVDFALPRTETRVGEKHASFTVTVDPSLSIAEAAKRRDFTVNAILRDVLSGQIVDPYNGRADLAKKVLRAVCVDHFAEDPLRVLRGAQFAARLGCKLDEDTAALCRTMDLSALSPARVEAELKKALLEADRPSVFFEVLRATGHLQEWFAELLPLIGLAQNPVYHPEGDVFTHTMECLDRAALVRGESIDPYKFMLLALTHDLGKAETTEKIDGVIHAYGHENVVRPALDMVARFCRRDDVQKYLADMIPLHMRPGALAAANSAQKATNKMFDAALSPTDLILFAAVDSPRMEAHIPFLRARYETYKEVMARPCVRGDDLLAAGLSGARMKEWLAYAHKLRLAGVDKAAALAQTIAYAKKNP